MKTYEIYQMGKLPPLTLVEADDWVITQNDNLKFTKNGNMVAIFNWQNIAGFREVINDEQN